MKIAIQGIKGSFHYQVAQECFGSDVEVLEYNSFNTLAAGIANNEVHQAVMAIENSIAGAILPNYALIDSYHLHIIKEYYLGIDHHLMALQNQKINDIKEVHSHPMALLQCTEFFEEYPHIKLIADIDTAATAKRIQDRQIKGIGAIASRTASMLYQLPILAESIQTIKNNTTRFVVLNKQESVLKSSIDKASLKFELAHQRGSLAAILNVISNCKLNLTKIQSLPKIQTPWMYSFFVDVTFNRYEDYEKTLRLLTLMSDQLKVLGEYKNANV